MKTIQSIVVVGATGMLGSKVSRSLKEEGFSVTAVVRNTKKAQQILGSSGIHIRKGNLKDKNNFYENLGGTWGAQTDFKRVRRKFLTKKES